MRLKNRCRELAVIFKQLHFTLCDLRSNNGGTNQLFHDRYLLIYSTDDEIKRGFHLSNSIQGSTRKAPLLVTPIPADLLDEVGMYVAGLRDPSALKQKTTRSGHAQNMAVRAPSVQQTHIEILFQSRTPSIRPTPERKDKYTDALLFLASLLADGLSWEALQQQLEQRGLWSGHFQVSDELFERLPTFVERLKAARQDQFAALWTSFGTWLAHLQRSYEVLTRLETLDTDALSVSLEQYLLDSVRPGEEVANTDVSIDPEVIGLTYLFRKDFQESLTVTKPLISHPVSRDMQRNWGVYFAIRLLDRVTPERLMTVPKTLWDSVPEKAQQNDLDPKTNSVMQILVPILAHITEQVVLAPGPRLHTALLTSPVPVLQAVGVAAKGASPEPVAVEEGDGGAASQGGHQRAVG
jgi:hypothetical protein